MLTELAYLFIAALIAFVLYPVWISFVYRFRMGEEIRPDGPEVHYKKSGTPTMGGTVFIFTVALVTFVFNRSRTQTLLPLFVASLAGLFGLIEDFSKVYKKSGLFFILAPYFVFLKRFGKWAHKLNRVKILQPLFKGCKLFRDFWESVGSSTEEGMQNYQKILFQAGIAGFVAYWSYFKLGWDYIWFPLLGNVHIGFLYPVFIFLLFLIVLNFVAFTDGLDGLAGGLGVFSFCGYWVIASVLNYNSLTAFCATFVGALLPFLYFNVYPARIFMGNVGSHVLGATLAVLAVVLHKEIALLVLCAVFLIDGVSSPLQSLSVRFTGKRLFRMAPMHHHFELLGWPEAKVVLRFWIFGAFFAFLGIFVALL